MQTVLLPKQTLKGQLVINLEVMWLEPEDAVVFHEALKLDDYPHAPAKLLAGWRQVVKEKLDVIYGMLRPRTCLVCGKHMASFDMHEGILSRQDVRGWPVPRKLLIMNELNCIPLHHQCHLDSPPSRQTVWDSQVKFYGKDIMKWWYLELPWKTNKPPRYFWEE